MQIDDPIDAFAVHGAAGAWGVLAAAIFDWGSLDKMLVTEDPQIGWFSMENPMNKWMMNWDTPISGLAHMVQLVMEMVYLVV